MIKFKIDILEELKKKGYNTTKLRHDKILSEGTIQRIRNNKGEAISTSTINIICKILNKQPGQILQYVPDDQEQEKE